MNIFFRTFDRCGQPVFIALAFLTLIFWFPLLWAWVVIDPPYRWAMWRNKGITPSIKPISRAPSLAFKSEPIPAPGSRSQEEKLTAKMRRRREEEL
jgi:hypothetical protein